MGIENLKRWHWIVIGLLVGAGLGYARAQFPEHPKYIIRHGVSVGQFVELAEGRVEMNRGGSFLERLAQLSQQQEEAPPALLDVIVYPAIEGKQYVTGRYLRRVQHDGPHYEQFEMSAAVPFVVPGEPAPEDSSYDVRKYLAAKAPEVEYVYFWWKHPSIEPAMWGAGVAVLIGGVWPFVLNVMVGAGLVRKPEPKEPEYDLDRFGKHPEEPKPAPAAATEEDIDKLHALEEELERNLTSASSNEAPAEASPAPLHAAAPIKQLSNVPVEPMQALDREEDPHEYRGEYYPVAHPISHKKSNEPTA